MIPKALCIWKSLRVLALTLASVLLVAKAGAPEHGRENEATIRCEAPEKPGAAVVLVCNFTNKSGGILYLLTTSPILEGPGKNRDDYIFLAPGGKRFENIFQYHEKKAGGLDFPILFHPTIHLRLHDLHHLRALRPKETVQVETRWEPRKDDHPGCGTWIARIKLLYLPRSSALYLLRQTSLAVACKDSLARSLQGAERQGNVSLTAGQPEKDRGYSYDGCRDVISESFHYLFSNTVPFKLTGE